MSVAVAGGDGYTVPGVSPQGLALRIVGERAAAGSQVVDQFRSVRGAGDLAGLVWLALGVFLAGEQDGQGCQVGRDLVFADIGVLGPEGVGAGGAGVAVAAPVGGPAVRP
jgi:hypothetical protein